MSGIRDTEKAVQKRIKDLAVMLGFHVSDLSQPRASMQTPGLPDLYMAHPEKHLRVWVEVKKPGGKVSEAQRRWHLAVESAGGRVWVCHSAEEFAAFCESYGIGRAA